MFLEARNIIHFRYNFNSDFLRNFHFSFNFSRLALLTVKLIWLTDVSLLWYQQDTLVQGCVSAVHQRKFRERLAKRSVYTLSEFDVTRSNPKFKLSDGPVSIRINEGIDFEKLPNTWTYSWVSKHLQTAPKYFFP